MPMKSFRDFTENSPLQLHEDSWLSKGYSIGQYSRHLSIKQQIVSVLSTVKFICERGKSAKDGTDKLNALLQAIQELTHVYAGFAELSQHNINTAVASTLLSEDLKKVISAEIEKALRAKR